MHEDLLDRVPKSFLVVGGLVFILQMIGCLLISEPKDETAKAPSSTEEQPSDTDHIVNADDLYSTDLVKSEPVVTTIVNSDCNSLGVK